MNKFSKKEILLILANGLATSVLYCLLLKFCFNLDHKLGLQCILFFVIYTSIITFIMYLRKRSKSNE